MTDYARRNHPSIRRFGRRRLNSQDLLKLKMFSLQMAKFMELVVIYRKNVVVSGGTGAGKTTLVQILLGEDSPVASGGGASPVAGHPGGGIQRHL